jgi:hypothetical protein
MRLDISRYECEMIVDYLGGTVLKAYRQHAEELRERLITRLRGDEKPDPKRNFVPMGLIRSPRLDAHIRPAKKRNWSYQTPRKPKVSTKATQHKPALSAQDILNSI